MHAENKERVILLRSLSTLRNLTSNFDRIIEIELRHTRADFKNRKAII